MYNSISIIIYKAQKPFDNKKAIHFPIIGNYNFLDICSLDDIYDKNEYINADLQDQEYNSFHRFYASLQKDKTIDNNFEDYAEDFFTKTDFHFIFLSMIHFNYREEEYKSSKEQYNDYLNDIKNELKSTDSNFVVYESLDCCDIVVFIKTNSYTDGTAIIQKIDNNKNVKYSYSVLAFNDESIKSDKYKGEIVDKITICGIISDYSKYNSWKELLDNQLSNINSYGRMGNEDIVINILKCNIKNFLLLYVGKDGLLNHQNELFNCALSYVRTHIDVKIDNNLFFNNSSNTEKSFDYKQRFLSSCDIAQNNNHIVFDDSIKKAATQVLNSCDLLAKENFALDLRDCIHRSVELFIKKVRNYSPIFDIPGQDLAHYNKSIKQFTTGIMSIVNGSLQADKMFFQVPGFDAVLYDVPSKLIVFYTAYVNNLADMLMDYNLKEPFAFLVCPDLYQYTYISKLFNEENRDDGLLLKVRIPVRSLFDIKRLLCELTHEVAHYVGKQSRSRDSRSDYEVNMLAAEIMKYLFNDIDFKDYNVNDNSNAYDKIFSLIVKRLNYYIDYIVLDNSNKNNNFIEYRNHQSFFKDILINAVCSFFYDSQNIYDIFQFISSDTMSISYMDLQILKDKMDKNITMLNTSYESIIEGLHELLKESYADLVMKITLGLTLEEYVLSFYKPLYNLYANPSDILSANNIGERITSILLCFGSSVESLDFNKYKETIIDNSEKNKFDNFIEELSKYHPDSVNANKRLSDALTSTTVKLNSDYLSVCKPIISRMVNTDSDYRPSLLYKEFNSNAIFDKISIIHDYIGHYRDSIFKKNVEE